MALERGWWDLELKGNLIGELSEADLEHIAEQIKKGFTGGEIIQDEIDDQEYACYCSEHGLEVDCPDSEDKFRRSKYE